jgi:hypothetical protein
VFDNVPVGLARELNEEVKNPDGTPRPLAFMYIDALTQRGRPKAGPERAAHGLSLVADMAAARFDEARTYELQALSRLDGTKGTKIQMTDRFFPLAANQLPLSFGAFLHADFRRYDYLVGLYDGAYALAVGSLAVDKRKPPVTREEWRAFVARFRAELDDQFCGVSCPSAPRDEDEKLARAFLLHLLSDELQARAPAEVAIANNSAAPTGERDVVWDLHEELYEQSELRRAHLREGGDRVAQASLEANRGGMNGFFWNLPARLGPMSPQQRVDARDDPNGFLVGEVDRLVRRQIDIENADEGRSDLAEGDQRLSKTFKDALYYSRLVAPALIERSPTWIGDAGTATRLGMPAIISFLLPQYAANVVTTCQHELGWEPKLRVGYRAREDGLRPWYAGPFLATQAALQWAGWCSDGASWSRWRFGAGLGWDPNGRIVDDVQVLATTVTSGEQFFRAGGVEGAVTFLTKLRLAVGSDGLWTQGGSGTLPHGFYVTLGLADLGGVVTWAAQSLFRPCQHGCENEVLP